MKNLSSNPVNVKSKIVSSVFSIAFYTFACFVVPVFWFMVDHWAFKVVIVLCLLVSFFNIIASCIELRRYVRMNKLNRRVVTVGEESENVAGSQRNI